MAVEYDISSDVAVIKETGSVSQCARVTQMYSGQITYDDEAGSKFATATINGKSQRVMLCIAVNGTVTYDDVPSLYSTVDGHRCLNIVTPTETGTPDDVPSLYETVVIDGQNVRAVRCIMINKTPVYDGVSSTCTFTGDDGKTHTAQLVNKITGGSVQVIIKGTSPLVLPDAIANSLSYVKAFGGTEQNGTPTPDAPVDIVSNNGVLRIPASAIGTGSQAGTPTPTTPIYPVFYQKGNLVLRAVGEYADTYDATTQTITRNVGVKVFDGSEGWNTTSGAFYYIYAGIDKDVDFPCFCTHYIGVSPQISVSQQSDKTCKAGFRSNPDDSPRFYIKDSTFGSDTTTFKQWLAQQYAAGTPVIVYYPLATPITESFTPSAYADGTVETIAIKNNIFTLVGATYDETISANGNPGASPNNGYSDYLAVTSGDVYNFSDRGLSGVALYDQDKVFQRRTGVSVGDYTIPADIAYIRVNFRQSVMNNVSITHTNYTATAEMLLKVGDYQDVQSILDGVVTRNVAIKVFDGTEPWSLYSNTLFAFSLSGRATGAQQKLFCTHLQAVNKTSTTIQNNEITCNGTYRIVVRKDEISTVEDWKQYLADQCANGTPVMLVYPLETPTTESVAGQTLQVTDGDNVLEITQASLTGLELEAQYQAAVSLTIQEVQDANLDNNVEVTIS